MGDIKVKRCKFCWVAENLLTGNEIISSWFMGLHFAVNRDVFETQDALICIIIEIYETVLTFQLEYGM